MRIGLWAAAAATFIASSALVTGTAQAAPPEQFAVTAALISPDTVSPAVITYSVNRAFRQVTAVSYTVDGGPAQTAALPVALTSKTSTGTISIPVASGAHRVVVTATGKGKDVASATADFTIVLTPPPADASAWCASVQGSYTTSHSLTVDVDVTKNAIWACLGANSDWVNGDDLGSSGAVYATYCVPLGDPLQMRLYISQASSDATRDDYSCVDMSSPSVGT